jgi:ABC-type dipeptide/oligopeptide/nickel transport system permease subunit
VKPSPSFDGSAVLVVSGIRAFAALPFVLVLAAIVIIAKKPLSPALVTMIIAAVSWPAIVTAFRNGFSGIRVVAAALDVAACALLLEATASYLGSGVQPPTASLGNMLANAESNLAVAPWTVVAPSVRSSSHCSRCTQRATGFAQRSTRPGRASLSKPNGATASGRCGRSRRSGSAAPDRP